MALAAAQARLEEGALQDADRVALLEQSETRLRAAFDSLAGETLRANSELFLRLARESLGREINPTVYSPAEFDRKRKANDAFLKQVLDKPRLVVIANKDELGKVAGG